MKKLVKFALIVGGITAAAKVVAAKKSEWQGLTEPAVREKIDAGLRNRIPDEKRAAVTDKVISKMRERGLLAEEDEPSAPTDDGLGEETDSGDAVDEGGES